MPLNSTVYYFIIGLVSIIQISKDLVVSSNSFQPYIDHGGTIVGLSGPDYCILASDTRISERYFIHSRNITRIEKVQQPNNII